MLRCSSLLAPCFLSASARRTYKTSHQWPVLFVFFVRTSSLCSLSSVVLAHSGVGGRQQLDDAHVAVPRGGDDDPSRDAGAVAASWEGGSLTNQELDNLVVRRQIVRAFLDQVEGLGGPVVAYLAGLEPPPLRVQPLRLPRNRASKASNNRSCKRSFLRMRPARPACTSTTTRSFNI